MTYISTINQLFLESMSNPKLHKFSGKYILCIYYVDNMYSLLWHFNKFNI